MVELVPGAGLSVHRLLPQVLGLRLCPCLGMPGSVAEPRQGSALGPVAEQGSSSFLLGWRVTWGMCWEQAGDVAFCWPLCGHAHQSVLSGQWLCSWYAVGSGFSVQLRLSPYFLAEGCSQLGFRALIVAASDVEPRSVVPTCPRCSLFPTDADAFPPPQLRRSLAVCPLIPPWHLPSQYGPESSWGLTSREEPASLGRGWWRR